MKSLVALCTMVGAYRVPSFATSRDLTAMSRAASSLHFSTRRASPTMQAEPCQDEAGIRADAEAAFRLLDLDGNGEISAAEMKSYLRQLRYSPSAADKIYAALDMDGCGVVHMADLQDGLAEYCRCSRCEPKFVEQVLAEADQMFAVVDSNGDGEISTAELRDHLLSVGYTEVAADAVFRSLDSNRDGSLSRDELRSGFLKYSTFREAIVAVVTTLVKRREWSPAQRR